MVMVMIGSGVWYARYCSLLVFLNITVSVFFCVREETIAPYCTLHYCTHAKVVRNATVV